VFSDNLARFPEPGQQSAASGDDSPTTPAGTAHLPRFAFEKIPNAARSPQPLRALHPAPKNNRRRRRSEYQSGAKQANRA